MGSVHVQGFRKLIPFEGSNYGYQKRSAQCFKKGFCPRAPKMSSVQRLNKNKYFYQNISKRNSAQPGKNNSAIIR